MRYVCRQTLIIRCCTVINAGDGQHSHPTQAMLDMFAIRRNKGDFSQLKVVIVGDILHSRVARSQIHALNILGAGNITAVGPKTLLPEQVKELGVHIRHDLDGALVGADVVIGLRLQKERMRSALLSTEDEYYRSFGLTERREQVTGGIAVRMAIMSIAMGNIEKSLIEKSPATTAGDEK